MEEYKNLEEIIKLSEKEINNNDKNVSAVLDLEDLRELRNLIARYKDLEKENEELLEVKVSANAHNRITELEKQLEEKEMQHELELIGKEEYTKAAMGEIIENYYTANEDCILKSKAEKMLEEIDEELEEMKVDNMYGRYDDYGGKRKFNEQFSYKFGEKEALQELLED